MGLFYVDDKKISSKVNLSTKLLVQNLTCGNLGASALILSRCFVKEEGKESFNLQSVRRVRSSGPISLKSIQSEESSHTTDKVDETPTYQSVFPQPKAPTIPSPQSGESSQPSMLSVPVESSFLKKESVLDNQIEIEIKPKVKAKTIITD